MKALILVDLQNDFCPGGRFRLPGDEAMRANRLGRGSTWSWPRKIGIRLSTAALPRIIRAVSRARSCACRARSSFSGRALRDRNARGRFHPLLDRSRIARVFQKVLIRRSTATAVFRQRASGTTRAWTRIWRAGQGAVHLRLADRLLREVPALDASDSGWPTSFVRTHRGVELIRGTLNAAIAECKRRGAGRRYVKSVAAHRVAPVL